MAGDYFVLETFAHEAILYESATLPSGFCGRNLPGRCAMAFQFLDYPLLMVYSSNEEPVWAIAAGTNAQVHQFGCGKSSFFQADLEELQYLLDEVPLYVSLLNIESQPKPTTLGTGSTPLLITPLGHPSAPPAPPGAEGLPHAAAIRALDLISPQGMPLGVVRISCRLTHYGNQVLALAGVGSTAHRRPATSPALPPASTAQHSQLAPQQGAGHSTQPVAAARPCTAGNPSRRPRQPPSLYYAHGGQPAEAQQDPTHAPRQVAWGQLAEAVQQGGSWQGDDGHGYPPQGAAAWNQRTDGGGTWDRPSAGWEQGGGMVGDHIDMRQYMDAEADAAAAAALDNAEGMKTSVAVRQLEGALQDMHRGGSRKGLHPRPGVQPSASRRVGLGPSSKAGKQSCAPRRLVGGKSLIPLPATQKASSNSMRHSYGSGRGDCAGLPQAHGGGGGGGGVSSRWGGFMGSGLMQPRPWPRTAAAQQQSHRCSQGLRGGGLPVGGRERHAGHSNGLGYGAYDDMVQQAHSQRRQPRAEDEGMTEVGSQAAASEASSVLPMEVPPMLRALLQHTAFAAAVKANELKGGGAWLPENERMHAAYDGAMKIPPLSLGKGIPQRASPPPKRTRTALSFSSKQHHHHQQQQLNKQHLKQQQQQSAQDQGGAPWPQQLPQQLLPPTFPTEHSTYPQHYQQQGQQQQQGQLGGAAGTFQQSSVLMWEVMNLVMMRSVLTSALGAMHTQMAGMANQLVVQAVTPAAQLASGLGGLGYSGCGQQQAARGAGLGMPFGGSQPSVLGQQGANPAAAIAALQAQLEDAQQQQQQQQQQQRGQMGGQGEGNTAAAMLAMMQQVMQMQQKQQENEKDRPQWDECEPPMQKSKSDGGPLAKEGCDKKAPMPSGPPPFLFPRAKDTQHPSSKPEVAPMGQTQQPQNARTGKPTAIEAAHTKGGPIQVWVDAQESQHHPVTSASPMDSGTTTSRRCICSSEVVVRPSGSPNGSDRGRQEKGFEEYYDTGPNGRQQQGQQDRPHPSASPLGGWYRSRPSSAEAKHPTLSRASSGTYEGDFQDGSETHSTPSPHPKASQSHTHTHQPGHRPSYPPQHQHHAKHNVVDGLTHSPSLAWTDSMGRSGLEEIPEEEVPDETDPVLEHVSASSSAESRRKAAAAAAKVQERAHRDTDSVSEVASSTSGSHRQQQLLPQAKPVTQPKPVAQPQPPNVHPKPASHAKPQLQQQAPDRWVNMEEEGNSSASYTISHSESFATPDSSHHASSRTGSQASSSAHEVKGHRGPNKQVSFSNIQVEQAQKEQQGGMVRVRSRRAADDGSWEDSQPSLSGPRPKASGSRAPRDSHLSDVSFFSSIHSGSNSSNSFGSSADSQPQQQQRQPQYQQAGRPAAQTSGTRSATPNLSLESSAEISFSEASEHYTDQESIDITGSMADNTHSSLTARNRGGHVTQSRGRREIARASSLGGMESILTDDISFSSADIAFDEEDEELLQPPSRRPAAPVASYIAPHQKPRSNNKYQRGYDDTMSGGETGDIMDQIGAMSGMSSSM